MKSVQNYLLGQVAAKNLSKQDALPMLKELFENQSKTVKVDDIAIVGMSCRFPGAKGLDQFWENMVNGTDAIREFPESRKGDVDGPIRDYFKGKQHAPEINYRRGAYLDRIDHFDAEYFEITPAEARCMDPLQRIFLEVTWEALEDAGYAEKELYGSRTGVYVGDTDAEYIKLHQVMEPYALPGNTISVVASRIAYLLNSASGSHLIDTACSASLAAVHHGMKGLITGDCDMAIAGGLNLTLFPVDEGLTDIGIASPDGVARTFDAKANGTVWGEGFGVIVLKTLERAQKEGDHIYAVIKGSSMNSDGKSNGITAPSARAQTEMIKEAWRNAGVSPRTIGYIEAHGTGTRLGDPIEIEGISNAFRSYTDDRQFCALGAVKTNIGHLDTAAGIAGLIKSVLMLKKKEIPATLHFQDPNAHIQFIESPVYVNTERIPWENPGDHPRRAGVSAFGLAGTNCHVILEEYIEKERSSQEREREQYLFTLSAKNKTAFNQLVEDYREYLVSTPHSLPDICFTSNQGRGHYHFRLAIVAKSLTELRERLDDFATCEESKRPFLTQEGIYYNPMVNRVDTPFECELGTSIEAVIEAYQNGSDVQWKGWYSKERRRVPLPVYPFSGKRYWVEYTPEHPTPGLPSSLSTENVTDWFYQLNWIEKPLAGEEVGWKESSKWLLFADEEGVATAVGERLRAEGHTPLLVETGPSFVKLSPTRYQVAPESEETYLALFQSLEDEGINITGIAHLWTCTEIRSQLRKLDDLSQSQYMGVYSLFYLLKALKKTKNSLLSDLRIISNYASLVTAEDTYLFPEKASLWGFVKVAAQEMKQVRFRCVDIETIDRKAEEIAQEVYQELIARETVRDQVAAWREGIRYTQQMDRMNLSELPQQKILIQDDRTYLIVGGAGAVGIETCRYLAEQGAVNLAVVNRTPLPEREQWEEVLRKSNDPALRTRIRELLAIEEMGSKVIYYAADVTDREQMQRVITDVKRHFGDIHGVIHAAMQLEEERIESQSMEQFSNTMAAKVQGTWVLNEVTKAEPLDFFLLYSSIAALLGGEGLGGYTAGNAFMDQYAHYQRRRGLNIQSINWSFFAMGASAAQLQDEEGLSYPITPGEYRELLQRLLSYECTQAIVANVNSKELAHVLSLLNIHFSDRVTQNLTHSKQGLLDEKMASKLVHLYEELKSQITDNEALNDLIQRNVTLGARFVSFEEELYQALKPKQDQEKKPVVNRVTLLGNEAGEYTETEEKLGRIWGEVLGIKEIDIHEDFFENGDSLMLMSVITKITEVFGLDVPIQVFYQQPTLSELSEWLEQEQGTEADELSDIPLLPRHFAD